MVGSSNLTDGGLQFNREATILLDDSEEPEAIVELRGVFAELWDYAPVLTDEALKRFTEAYKKFRPSEQTTSSVAWLAKRSPQISM
jgi:phosphatidylserine/phosphatidylglycerophosphate/cardiolipin synthase-like enzyme